MNNRITRRAVVKQYTRLPSSSLYIHIQIPEVKQKTENRPQRYHYCKGETFQRWGKVRKPV